MFCPVGKHKKSELTLMRRATASV